MPGKRGGRKKKDERKSPSPITTVTFPSQASASATATSISSGQFASTQASTLTSSVATVSGNGDAITIGGSNLLEAEDAVGGVVGAARQRAAHAHAVAVHASQDANEIESSILVLKQHHKKLFLQKAFGLNLDGTKITDPSLLPSKLKKYKSVKGVDEYHYMIDLLLKWGNDKDINQSIFDRDPKMVALRKFRKENHGKGYHIAKHYRVDTMLNRDGSTRHVLIHKSCDRIVSSMLDVYDVIWDFHSRIGHMAQDKTVDAASETHYSVTQELVKLWIQDCPICLEKQPSNVVHVGAKKPIISSNFRDRFQVDLIDMRTLRKEDVYGQMMRWIMTVKDHSTQMVWLTALPFKEAKYVAHELEKYFGFVGYPHIFHTGAFSSLCLYTCPLSNVLTIRLSIVHVQITVKSS